MTITLRVDDMEAEAIKAYASLHGVSVSDVMRRAILEKIEDEHDLKMWEKAYAAFAENPVAYPHDEVGKMLGLT